SGATIDQSVRDSDRTTVLRHGDRELYEIRPRGRVAPEEHDQKGAADRASPAHDARIAARRDLTRRAALELIGRLCRSERPEESVRLVVRAGREEQRVRIAAGPSVADTQAPEPVDPQRLARVRRLQAAAPITGGRIEHVDRTVAEVADEDVAGDSSPARRGNGEAPRRVERTT